jgi:hypothetical protein
VVSLISVCINTINRDPSGPLVCSSYMYTKEKAMLKSYIHARGGRNSTTETRWCWGAPSNCDHFCFGPFVASWAPSMFLV